MSDSTTKSYPKSITFLRKRDYRLLRELGAGACGKTVLLYDDIIDQHFVCKKFKPYSETARDELFTCFMSEIKLLHRLHHRNVVRVFNYYIYPDEHLGYILMEFVESDDIQTHAKKNPEHLDNLFLQAVSGFQYMEEMGVLHRDIRPSNLLVTSSGELKIIDLGFGKRIIDSTDFDKSITLNWWCEIPEEFAANKYDWATEVYFIGKLFEKLIGDTGYANFGQTDVLRRMCARNPQKRLERFSDVAKLIRTEKFSAIVFTRDQIESYRVFADQLICLITKIDHGTKYFNDVDQIKRQLSDAYRSFMLEELVPDSAIVIQCFIDGAFYYRKTFLNVSAVKGFVELLNGCNSEQSRIVLANLQTKLDAVQRYAERDTANDEMPF